MVRVGAVLDADVDLDAAFLIGHGPIDDLVGDEHGVRNDDLGSLQSPHRARSEPNRADFTHQVADLDLVAHLEGTAEHQDETRDEVLDHVLKAETDADAEGARQHRQLVELNARGRQRENETEEQHDVVGARRRDLARALGELEPRQHIFFEEEAKEASRVDREPTPNARIAMSPTETLSAPT